MLKYEAVGLRHYNRPVCERICSGPDESRAPGPHTLVGVVLRQEIGSGSPGAGLTDASSAFAVSQ
jgi:hypothetical protein